MLNFIFKKFFLKIYIFNCGSGWFNFYLGFIIKFYLYFFIRQLKMNRIILIIYVYVW